jgi:hypothetical protein
MTWMKEVDPHGSVRLHTGSRNPSGSQRNKRIPTSKLYKHHGRISTPPSAIFSALVFSKPPTMSFSGATGDCRAKVSIRKTTSAM